jgi:hypothetical protein
VNRIIDIPAVHIMCVPKSPACRDLGTKVADRSTPCGICDAQHTIRSVSAASGCGR